MSLTLISFLISVVSLLVAIATFMIRTEGTERLRLIIGIPFFLITILFCFLGLFSFLGSDPALPWSFQPGGGNAARIEDLGLYLGSNAMPAPASAGQVIVAHGDIDDSGTCHIKEFGPGVQVQGLGNGTFRLVRITGTREQIAAAAARIQQEAANDAGGSCPWK